MKSLRRHYTPNADYFITVVSHDRRQILLNDPDLFLYSWHGEVLTAWVILPDHFHVILNVGTSNISDLVHRFKVTYSRNYRNKNGPGRVWQNRFWDHIIRDQTDMNKHLDYIHYNAVKHSLVNDPFEYKHSSLQSWFEKGHYGRSWGIAEPEGLDGDFGE